MPHCYFFCAQKIGTDGKSLLADLNGGTLGSDEMTERALIGAADAVLGGENLTPLQSKAINTLRTDEFDFDSMNQNYPAMYDLMSRLSINNYDFFPSLKGGAVNLKVRLQ